MKKKGISPAIIILATIAFTAAVIILLLSSLSRPGMLNQITKKGFIIGSDVKRSDEYITIINQLNFLKSTTVRHETTTALIQELHDSWTANDESRFNELSAEIDEAAADYLKTYENKCVILEIEDNKGKKIWLNTEWTKQSLECKMAGPGELATAPRSEIQIPTTKPSNSIKMIQRTVKKTNY
ncbi:hypothetical protein HYU11_01500 [Candidatus Woesearchaeota archaeon]|nr:hypothetical protein [Candidatus Woesearchaeota archaeon]